MKHWGSIFVIMPLPSVARPAAASEGQTYCHRHWRGTLRDAERFGSWWSIPPLGIAGYRESSQISLICWIFLEFVDMQSHEHLFSSPERKDSSLKYTVIHNSCSACIYAPHVTLMIRFSSTCGSFWIWTILYIWTLRQPFNSTEFAVGDCWLPKNPAICHGTDWIVYGTKPLQRKWCR